jgi:hypothetical protein
MVCFLLGFLLGLLSNLEDAGSMLLRNIGGLIGLHGATSQKIALFIVNTVRTSDPRYLKPQF